VSAILRPSLRRFLLLGILGPVLAVVGMNTANLYVQALAAADTAYDRTLLASAKAIGEQLEVAVDQGQPRLRSTVPYSALEAFEADNRSRMYYKVTGFGAEMVSGFDDLPAARPDAGRASVYAARWCTSTTTSTVVKRCAWRCCCSRWRGSPARAWRRSRWPRRWNCAARWPGSCSRRRCGNRCCCWR
jgi:hypothetical protein